MPPTWSTEQPFQALALTGGGYRGLFTASALRTMEDHIRAPIASRFDLITGTSIGGIIALAAAFEIPMRDVVRVFEEHGERIFPNPAPTGRLAKLVDLARYASKPRYSAEALRTAFRQILPDTATLADAKHAVAIPAVNVTQGRPQVFKTRHVRQWTRDLHYKALDVAVATAAAPTFFELAEIDRNRYVDGGLFANAPDLIALHEAEYFFGVPVEAVRLLSIGTTTQSYSLSFADKRDWGIADWMSEGARLFSITISAQQQFVDQIVQHRLADRYLRIDRQPSPEQARDLGLDRASAAARSTLTALGSKAASDLLGGALQPFFSHRPQLEIVRGE